MAWARLAAGLGNWVSCGRKKMNWHLPMAGEQDRDAAPELVCGRALGEDEGGAIHVESFAQCLSLAPRAGGCPRGS